MPRMIAPVATSSLTVDNVPALAVNACGLRNASIRPIWLASLAGAVAVDEGQVVVEAVDRVGQHRVAEPVDGVGELRHDRRIEIGRVGEHERIDVRLQAACELLEHEVLILHLGDEAGGLEQALAVPCESRREGIDRGAVAGRRQRGADRQVDEQPLVDECQIAGGDERRLVLVDEAVVLGVEDSVDGGQADVLVAAPVAGDEVRVRASHRHR